MPQHRAVWAALFVGTAAAAALVPAGVAVVGAVHGGLAALLAIGLVLVHQAHRFVHLGHAALGALCGAAVAYLVAHAGWHYWFAYPAGLALGAVLSVAAGMLLAERLADASRVVVVVCSIGTAFVFGGAQTAVALATGAVLRTEVPLGVSIDLFPVRLSGAHALAVVSVVVAVVASWFLLLRTDVGLRMRALATGPVHARRLGVDPHGTWRVLWAFCGVLAAAGGIAAQPLVGTSFAPGLTLGPLLLALTAAVVGGMRDVPLTVAAAIGLGVAHQAVSWHVPIAATADLLLVAVIAAVLILRTVSDREPRADPDAWRFVRSIRPVDARHHLSLRVFQVTGIGVLALGASGVITRASDGDAQRIGTIGVFAIAAIAVHVSATFGGRLSLGHWAIAGVACVVASVVGPASLSGLVLAVACGTALAVALVAFWARAGSLGYITATFALAAAVPVLHARVSPVVTGESTFGPLDLTDQASTATAIVAALAASMLAVGLFRRSRTGTAALAVREDRRLASVHGVPIARTTIAVEALAGALCGLAGFLYLWSQGTVHPDAFATARSLELVAMAVVGGLGSVAGTVLGAGIVQGAQLFAGGPFYLLATGAGIFVVAVWLRGGIASLIDIARTPARRDGRGAGASGRSVAPANRFPDAPADATRKARRHAVVRSSGTTAAAAAAIVGWVVSAWAGDSPPHVAVWIVAGTGSLAVLGAAGGYRLGYASRGAVALLAATTAALRWPWVAPGVVAAAGWMAGTALRSVAQGVPAALRSAASGWVAVQVVAGAVAGLVLALATRTPWPLAAAVAVGLIAARSAAPRADGNRILPVTGNGVHVRDLSVRLGDAALISHLDLDVAPGTIVGIAGANGSGKSTLLRCIAGEVRPESGTIVAAGMDAATSSPDELARGGVLLTEANHGSNGELTVRENLGVASLLATGRRELSEASDLGRFLHPRLVAASRDRAAVLSGGERRLLALAQALLIGPRVLLADELGRGLSDAHLALLGEMLQELASRGCAVVVVEHDPVFLAQIADDVLHLHRGRMHDAASLALSTGVDA